MQDTDRCSDIVRRLECQCRARAESMDQAYPDRYLWAWPQPPRNHVTPITSTLLTSSLCTGGVGCQLVSSNFSPLENSIISRVTNDSTGTSRTETLSFAPSANEAAPSSRLRQGQGDATSSLGLPVLEYKEHRAVSLQHDWLKIGNSHRTGQKIVAQVVIADLDPVFISACTQHFGPCVDQEGRGVHLVHGPLQQAIIDSLLAGEDVHTYVVFGSYAYFPGAEQGDTLIAGLAKALREAFPKSWKDFDDQCGSEVNEDEPWNAMPWMARKGQVWVAEPEVPNALTLVACAAYPRDQSPTEAEAAARRFETALRMIKEREEAASLSEKVSHRLPPRSKSSKGKSPLCTAETLQAPSQRKLRIITHAMGSFEGHPDVDVFATGLFAGLERFQLSV